MLDKMKAVLMCAGKSTRTYPLTLTKPKPLLKIENKTILEHNLEMLSNLGVVDEVIIVIGYFGEQVKKKIGDKYENQYKSIKIKYCEQKEQNGTGGAILSVKEYFIKENIKENEKINEKIIVMNGDDIYPDIENIKKCLNYQYCILTKQVEDVRDYGEVEIKNKKVIGLKEKPNEKRKGLVNCGFYVLDYNVFYYNFKLSQRGEYEITDYLNYLIKNKEVNYVEAKYWFPITYPWSLLNANEFFVSNIEKEILGKVEKGATIKGNVKVGKNTEIRAGAYIEGPIVIGENCKIGPNCYIRAYSSIGNNCKIGNAVEIKNSIIGDNTSIGHLSYVGDSVIGENVNFGAGTITANLRHDNKNISSLVKGNLIDTNRRKFGTIIGDNVHTGIHTSIYPGRKIWPNKTTLPGEIVKKDIEN